MQRLKTQLDQYTDLSDEQKAQITQIAPPDKMQGFKGMYLETAKRLKEQQDRDQTPPEVQQLDFEFVLFASSVIDYDYIMGLIAKLTQQKPGKLTMNREQLIGLIQSDAKFIDEARGHCRVHPRAAGQRSTGRKANPQRIRAFQSREKSAGTGHYG